MALSLSLGVLQRACDTPLMYGRAAVDSIIDKQFFFVVVCFLFLVQFSANEGGYPMEKRTDGLWMSPYQQSQSPRLGIDGAFLHCTSQELGI